VGARGHVLWIVRNAFDKVLGFVLHELGQLRLATDREGIDHSGTSQLSHTVPYSKHTAPTDRDRVSRAPVQARPCPRVAMLATTIDTLFIQFHTRQQFHKSPRVPPYTFTRYHPSSLLGGLAGGHG
jgi:hypothetical protein